MRYEINNKDEIIIDTKENRGYSYDDIEDMYEDAFWEAYEDDDCDVVYALKCVLEHIEDGYNGDLFELIYDMVN